MELDFTLARKSFIDFVKKSLIGPGHENDSISDDFTINHEPPSSVYSTAILFPITKDAGIDAASEEVEEEYFEDLSSDDQIIQAQVVNNKRRYMTPSSAGFSFYASADVELYIKPWAVQYTNKNKAKHEWKRTPMNRFKDDEETQTIFAPTLGGVEKREIWFDNNGKSTAEIYTLWREHEDGWIITVSLSNKQQAKETGKKNDIFWDELHKSFYEVELSCEITSGELYPYPFKNLSLMSHEEQELEFQYRHHKIYAIGHGVAANWDFSQKLPEIKIDFLPQTEVPIASAIVEEIDQSILSIERLSKLDQQPSLINELNNFIATYEVWQKQQLQKSENTLYAEEKATAMRITERINVAIKRMKDGVALLKNNSKVKQAFSLANEAMLNQMVSTNTNKILAEYNWRPFQLGFFLLALESVVDENSQYRDTVDLIWFPTGGGKTEAYLGLIAFQIIYRRLTNSASYKGTAVIMRYTLRLLTQQQFIRATKLICALELLRRKNEIELRLEPITTGMWVGSATTPNQYTNQYNEGAVEALDKAINSNKAPHKLVITECPWCAESLWKSSRRHGYIKKPELKTIEYQCLNTKCDFYNSPLPINVIDEALYKAPPTLLFATVDKFARLTWSEKTSSLLGGSDRKAPELIVQDELHLISSALGSIVGLYEAALDVVIQNNGSVPKYIASTATIKNASEQIKSLYGRSHAVFPSPGLSADDSFFTRIVPLSEKPGRLYVGYLASLMGKDSAFSALTSSLLLAPIALFGKADQERQELMDAWWTMIVYHGSLRSVGNSQNELLYHSAERMKSILKRLQLEPWYEENVINNNATPDRIERLSISQITGNKTAEENSITFQNLEDNFNHNNSIDVTLATNMISVGLDVSRLSLMVINGQPLTTAEYIQSSSRVGRSELPGVIFTNYYKHQARSLSHYENFRPYHEAFYRFVEPTSVTPYTKQARKRALHAALVIVMRHSNGLNLNSNNSASKFNSQEPKIARAIENLRKRCNQAILEGNINEQAKLVNENISQLVNDWENKILEHSRNGRPTKSLHYEAKDNDKSAERLLQKYDAKIKGLWATLDSMRNVEDGALMQSTGPYSPPSHGAIEK